MHRDVIQLVDGGYGAQEIIDAFVNVYGERVLMAPKKSGFNLLAWLLPGAALVVGGGALALLLKRWGERSRDRAATTKPFVATRGDTDATPDELARSKRRFAETTRVIAALVIGTLLAVGALAFVLYPVFFGVARQTDGCRDRRGSTKASRRSRRCVRSNSIARRASSPTSDYAELKTRYTKEAISAMRRADGRRRRGALGRRDRGGGPRLSRDARDVSGARAAPRAGRRVLLELWAVLTRQVRRLRRTCRRA